MMKEYFFFGIVTCTDTEQELKNINPHTASQDTGKRISKEN